MRAAAGRRTEHLTALDECVFIRCSTEELMVIHHLCRRNRVKLKYTRSEYPLRHILRSPLQELSSFLPSFLLYSKSFKTRFIVFRFIPGSAARFERKVFRFFFLFV